MQNRTSRTAEQGALFRALESARRDLGGRGFVPAELPGYVAERGMRLFLDMSAREAADRYLLPLGRQEPAATFYRIAAAEIL